MAARQTRWRKLDLCPRFLLPEHGLVNTGSWCGAQQSVPQRLICPFRNLTPAIHCQQWGFRSARVFLKLQLPLPCTTIGASGSPWCFAPPGASWRTLPRPAPHCCSCLSPTLERPPSHVVPCLCSALPWLPIFGWDDGILSWLLLQRRVQHRDCLTGASGLQGARVLVHRFY